MKLGTHFVPLLYKITTWSVIFVSYLYLNTKINIIILDIISQLSNQLHSLIVYHFKYIHSTPQLQHPIFPYVWDIGQYQYFLFCFLSILIIITSYQGLSTKYGQPIPRVTLFWCFYPINTIPTPMVVCWVVWIILWFWYVIGNRIVFVMYFIALC